MYDLVYQPAYLSVNPPFYINHFDFLHTYKSNNLLSSALSVSTIFRTSVLPLDEKARPERRSDMEQRHGNDRKSLPRDHTEDSCFYAEKSFCDGPVYRLRILRKLPDCSSQSADFERYVHLRRKRMQLDSRTS